MSDLNQTANEYLEENEAREEEKEDTGGFDIDVPDDELITVMDRRIKKFEEAKKSQKIDMRTTKNIRFYKGQHVDADKVERWQIPYIDNIIWQNLEYRISLASARMPDIIATPASDENESTEMAKEVEQGLRIKIKNAVTRRLIKDGLRHMSLSFTDAIKVRWDKSLDTNGDFVFELVKPKNLGFDTEGAIPHQGFTSDQMDYIFEYIEESLSVVISKFPNKEKELMEAAKTNKDDKVDLHKKITYIEMHFTWYTKKGDAYEGTAWKFQNILLKKMKQPYYDWDGDDEVSEEETDENNLPVMDTKYNNYFKVPRKPYIFFSHMNLGESPYETTTPVEQSISLQQIANKRGRQITEISDRAVPRLAFAGDHIDKDEAQAVSNDPDENIYLDQTDKITEAVMQISADPPSPILFKDLQGIRGQLDNKFGTNAQIRGESMTNESGISKQITREGNLQISDDIVDIVVERVVKEMAGWALQMMKLFYKEEHYITSMGKDGEMVEASLSREKIEEGMVVDVRADSTDEQTTKSRAMELAGNNAIDPLTLAEDLDVPNPKERTRRLISFLQGGDDGYARYSEEIGLTESAEGAPGTPKPEPGTEPGTEPGQAPGGAGGTELMGAEQAQKDIQAMVQGQQVQPQGLPGEEYVATFAKFVSSGTFEQLPEEVQQAISQYVQGLKQTIEQNIQTNV